MPYYCAQCKTSSGCCQSDFEKHFSGKKHKFNVKKEKRPYYCDLCYFLSPLQNDLEKHLAGEKHKYKVQKKKMPYFCDPCYFTCLCKNDLEKHLSEMEHKDKVNAKKEKAKENEGTTMNTQFPRTDLN